MSVETLELVPNFTADTTVESNYAPSILNFAPVPSEDKESIPAISTRPLRTLHVPSKFTYFTGLTPHLVSSIQHKLGSPVVSLSLSDYITTLPFDPVSIHFVASTSIIHEPTSYKQAIKHYIWCKAMGIELAGLEANKTWEVCPLPLSKKIIGCKWLFKVKYLANGDVDRFKARLVAKGFTHTEGLDYFETFAHVAKISTLRILLTMTAKHRWFLKKLDVTNAFLHGIFLQPSCWLAF